MMTIAQTLTRTTPLNFARPAAGPTPTPAQGPADALSLGSSVPQEPDLRDPEQGKSRLALGLAAGALALVGVGIVGGLVSTQQVQPAQLQTERTVDPGSDPISQEQWAQMKQVGSVTETDNASAREVKEGYLSVAEEMLTEGDAFKAQGEELSLEGRRMEYVGKELGNGTHEMNGATITVELRENGIKVTWVEGDVTKSVVREGETTVVTRNEGHGEVRLEDTAAWRSIEDGQTTRTLYTRSGLIHEAGEFEVKTASRSVQQTTRVNGLNITRHTEQLVSGYAGSETISETQKWEKPDYAITLYPGTVVKFHSERTSHNLNLDSDSDTFRDVEVRADGSTKVRHNFTLEGEAVEVVEPAQDVSPPTTLIQE